MTGYEIRVIDDQKGKGLFATKFFKAGETIFEEYPLVSCQFAWNATFKYQACDLCMRPLETAEQNVRRLSVKPDLVLPYPECCNTRLDAVVVCEGCGVKYCSVNCKNSAFATFHQSICYKKSEYGHPIATLQETWKQMHYPPETTNIMLLLRILAMIKQSPDPAATCNKFKQFCHRTVNDDAQLVHKLLGDKFIGQINMLREMTSKTLSGEYIQQFYTPEGFCSLLALIGTNGQGIGTSPMAQWVNNCSDLPLPEEERKKLDEIIDNVYEYMEAESDTFLNSEGSGLYELQSACNHSCVPNAEPHFGHGNYCLQLKAMSDINPGQEILISYIDECMLGRSRHSRQKVLAANYLFKCSCEKCISEAEDPDETSAEDMSEGENDVEDMSD